MARVGITSGTYINQLLPLADTDAETIIISLGVNDDETVDTLTNLRAVRRQVTGRSVYWLLPGIKEQVRTAIQTVAAEHGDRLIDTRPYVGRDHLHPNGAGYQQIAAQSYGDGGFNYAPVQPAPVEVAEAPARLRQPGESAFHINYAQIPAMRVSHGSDMLYFTPPRRLSGNATPRDRIRNLRETARAESRLSHHGYSEPELRMAATILRLPVPPRDTPGTHASAGMRVATAPAPSHVQVVTASHHAAPPARLAAPTTHAATACSGGPRVCMRSARG